MKTTLRDFVDGKADLAFAHYAVPKPIYEPQILDRLKEQEEKKEKQEKD